MVGFRGVMGGARGFSVENKGKGEGGGRVGGGGRDRQRNRQVNAQALSKLRFRKLPFSFSPIFAENRRRSQHTAETR